MHLRQQNLRWAGEAGLALALAMTLAGAALAIRASWGDAYWPFDGGVGVAVSALALCRRWHRGWTAVAGLAIATAAVVVAGLAGLPHEPGPATALALAVLVGSAVRELPTPWAATVTAGALVVVVAAWAFGGFIVVAVLNTVTTAAAVAVGAGLRLSDERRRGTAERIRRDERLDLARELHDVVAHHITGMVVHAQAAQLVARRHSGDLAASIADIERAGSTALTAMRRVVGLLRDEEDAAPAAPGPEELTALVARFSGAEVRLRMPDDTGAWPPEVTSTVYRVVREALTNVARHAPQAREVTVTVDRNGAGVTVEVADDGPHGRASRGGYGLTGMRERVEALGGTLSAGPRPDTGWRVFATVPVARREAR